MKVEVAQTDLARGLGIVARAVSARSNLPVLANVLTQAEDDGLRLTTTNLAVGLVSWIPARVAKKGETTIPAALFADLVDSLHEGDQIALELDKGETTKLQSGGFKASLKGIDPDDFPAMKSLVEEPLTTVKQGDLLSALNQTVFNASSDQTRGVLTGVQLRFAGDSLTFYATDNYRFATRVIPLGSPVEPVDVIVPAMALTELVRVLSAEAEEPAVVVLASSKNELMFKVPGTDVVCRLLSGGFPDVKRAIPTTASTTITVGREALLGVVRPSILIAPAGANSIDLEAGPDGIVISSAAEIGDHVGKLEAQVEGDPVSMRLNAKFLSDVLTNLDSETISIGVNGPLRPLAFRPVAGSDVSVQVISPINPKAKAA